MDDGHRGPPRTEPRASATFDAYTLSEIRRAAATGSSRCDVVRAAQSSRGRLEAAVLEEVAEGVAQRLLQRADRVAELGDGARGNVQRVLPVLLRSEPIACGKTEDSGQHDSSVAAVEGDLEHAIELLKKHDAIATTVERARHYGAMARDALEIFGNSPAKTALPWPEPSKRSSPARSARSASPLATRSRRVYGCWVVRFSSGIDGSCGLRAAGVGLVHVGLVAQDDAILGSYLHVTSEWFQKMAGIRLNHIPYGSAHWQTDLLAGTVDVTKRKVGAESDRDDTSAVTRLAVIRPGAVIGEMSMLDGEPRYATCTAIDAVEAAVLTRAAVARLIAEQPPVAAKLLVKITQLLAQRLRIARGTAQARLRKLEEGGVITGYTVRLRPDSEPQRIRAWMSIAVEGNAATTVIYALRGEPAVGTLHTTNGRWDIVAEVRAESLESFDAALTRIRMTPGIANTETSILLASYR